MTWLPHFLRSPARRRIEAALYLLLWLLPLLGAGYLAWRVGWVAVHRIQTFHELEFQEGDMALAAMRVLNHQSLYPDRDGSFIPLLYTPLMHRLAAQSMRLLGEPSLFAGRLVSVLAALGCTVLLAGWVLRETRRAAAALFAAGVFIGIAPLVGWFFDLYRVDMVFLFFTALGAAFILDRKSTPRREIVKGILAGAFFALGCLAKQTAGPLALALTALAAAFSPLRAVWMLSSFLTVGGLLVLHEWVNGFDFWYYCLDVLRQHPMNLEHWGPRLLQEFFLPAALPLALIAAWVAWSLGRRRWRQALAAPVLALAVYISCRSVLKIGGYVNHYLPAWFFIALYLGVTLGDLMNARRGVDAGEGLKGRPPFRRQFAAPVLMLAALAWLFHFTGAAAWQGWGHGFPLRETDALATHLPHDLDQGRQFINAIRALDGSVWVMHGNYYAWLAGRPTEIGVDNVRDLTIGAQPVSPYAMSILDARKHKYLLLNNGELDLDWLDPQIRDLIRQNYERVEDWEARFGWRALRPVDRTGQKPRSLWIRKEDLDAWRQKHAARTP